MPSPDPGATMRRRELLGALGGAVAWPLAARAQQLGEPHRCTHNNCPQTIRKASARRGIIQGLQEAGWAVGRNERIDIRWAGVTPTAFAGTRRNWLRSRRTSSSPKRSRPLWRYNRRRARCRSCSPGLSIRSVPVWLRASAAGRQHHRLCRFRIRHERKMAGTAQRYRAAGEARSSPSGFVTTVGIGQFAAIQGVAPSFGVELSPLVLRDASEIEPAITAFGRGSNGG